MSTLAKRLEGLRNATTWNPSGCGRSLAKNVERKKGRAWLVLFCAKDAASRELVLSMARMRGRGARATGREATPCRMPTSRPVHIELPDNVELKRTLRENLQLMGLECLLDLPWNVVESSLIRDLLMRVPSVNSRFRARPGKWNEQLISQVYGVPAVGEGMCDPNGELRSMVEACFQQEEWVTRNGWKVEHCLDTENLGPLLAFLTPILNPEARTRISLSLATTVIASLSGRKRINWAEILCGVIRRLERKIHSALYTYIAPYISHIYHHTDCFTADEERTLHAEFQMFREERLLSSDSLISKSSPVEKETVDAPEDVTSEFELSLSVQLMELLGCEKEEIVDQVMGLISATLPDSPISAEIFDDSSSEGERIDSPDGEVTPEVETADLNILPFEMPKSDSQVPEASSSVPPFAAGSSSTKVPVMPRFVVAEPLKSQAPGPLDLRNQDPSVMSYEFMLAIQRLAYGFTQIVDPVPLVVRKGKSIPFIPTYAFVMVGDRVPLLPIDLRRRDTLDSVDIWSWVYHCRRVVAPCLPYRVDCPWPSSYVAWVGPDGVPIRKESDDVVRQHRVTLLKFQQVKGKNSKARQQISWIHELPAIQTYPQALCLPLR